jgi:uncharacterized Zn-binding protein involved in type VI secretion
MRKFGLSIGLLLSGIVAALVPAAAQNVVTGGSSDVMVGDKPAARAGDVTTGGAIVEGSKDVFINGKPAAIGGSRTGCGGILVGGGGSVFINGKPMARSGDQATGCK